MSLFHIPLTIYIIFAILFGLILSSNQILPTNIDTITSRFILILQITTLPYISLTIITGIGTLSEEKITQTAKQALIILLLLIGSTLCFISLAPIAFPDWKSADFYSANSFFHDVIYLNYHKTLLYPDYYSFKYKLVPIIIIFSIFIGLGFMGIVNKKHSLLVLEHLQTAIAKVNLLMMRLIPLVVFLMAMKTAENFDISQLDGLVVYVITASVVILFLSLLILPATVSIITPFNYQKIISISHEAMIIAFATGNIFIVIPLMVEKTKHLVKTLEKQAEPQYKNSHAISKFLIPISFSLPIGGKLIAILFVLFAAWFSGTELSLSNYINLLANGVPQLFNDIHYAIVPLLALVNVSSTMVEPYIIAENLLMKRMSLILSVSFTICFTLLVTSSMIKRIKFKWRLFTRYALITPLLLISALFLLRYNFSEISHQYQGYSKFIKRDFLLTESGFSTKKFPHKSITQPLDAIDVLTKIEQRGFIRVGYFNDNLPYSFHNDQGKLVGFDIEIMHQLAIDLGVAIEFVRIFRQQASTLLTSGYLDITTGIPATPMNLKEFTLTSPYSKQQIAFLTKDKISAEFNQWENIKRRKDLIVALPEMHFYKNALQAYIKQDKIVDIASPELFFNQKYQHIDAMLLGAATASAWTLLYPNYSVVIPQPTQPLLSIAFPINRHDHAFEVFMRYWIKIKQQSRMFDKLYHYWVEAKKTHVNFN